MNKIQRTVLGMLGMTAILFSVGTAAYAHDVAEVEQEDNEATEETVKPVKPEKKEMTLEEAKAVMLRKLEKKETHLGGILEKIQSNPNLREEQKEKVANGIQKALDMLSKLKTEVQEATTLGELKKVHRDTRKDVKHLKHLKEKMRKHMKHQRLREKRAAE